MELTLSDIGTRSELEGTPADVHLGAEGDHEGLPFTDRRDDSRGDLQLRTWTVLGDRASRYVPPEERQVEIDAFIMSLVERGFAPAIERAVAKGDARAVSILVSYK